LWAGYALRILEMPRTEQSAGIRFHYLKPARFPVAPVRKVLKSLFLTHKRDPEAVSYVFCSDQYLLGINRSYLNHNYFTDIVTFDLSEPYSHLRADIYISIDRVKENAAALGVPAYHELIRVILHGALHLVGYSDKSAAGRKKMRAAEDKFLALVFKNVPRETKAKKKFHVKHRKRVS